MGFNSVFKGFNLREIKEGEDLGLDGWKMQRRIYL
jgi:hypothetical protein